MSEPSQVPDALSITLPPEAFEALVSAVAERVLQRLAERDEETGWPEWMGVETAARYLDASAERVRKLVARRAIPYTQEGPGCRVFFSRRDLDIWMNTYRVERRP